MADALTHVAFDIETTGFTVEDEITVIGYDFPMGSRVFVQSPDETVGSLQQLVREQVDQRVIVSEHPSENELLEAFGDFTKDRFQDGDLLLVAFNGEVWGGGFDLPFFRTRLNQLDVEWPFRDVPYADVLPIIQDRFNTTEQDGDSRSDLAGVYELLCSGQLGEIDPFKESSEAVQAFEDGRYEELVRHNIADIRRTRELSRLTQHYCSKSDYRLKSLTPVIHG